MPCKYRTLRAGLSRFGIASLPQALCACIAAWRTSLVVFVVVASGAHAATTPSGNVQNTGAQATIDALTRANQSVVGVQVVATEGARSVQTLGARRSGSGVVIQADGLILTIGYLLLEAASVEITTPGNKTLPARIVAYDLATGFGLLRPVIPLRGITPAPLGSAEASNPGDALMASTGALPGTEADVNMTQLVSKRPFSGYWEYHIDYAIFTSPPVENHSGAPLFNQKGELVGIGSLFVLNAPSQNIRLPGNMFVPIDLLKPILAEMQETGTSKLSRRPWLGLTSSEQAGRVQIVRVSADSPAQTAGLQPGDLVLAIDDTKVTTLEAFYKKLWDRPEPQSDVKLTVRRGSDIQNVVLKAIDRMSTMVKPAGI